MTTKEMMKTKAKPGYWFVNVANLGDAPNWVEQVQPHQSGLLFGYEPQVLLAKQYKAAR